MLETLKQWDRELLIWLNHLEIAQFDSFWLFVTRIDVWIPLFALYIVLFIRYFGWKRGGVLILSVVLAFLIVHSLTYFSKISFERLRPNNEVSLATVLRLLQNPESYSFFSGHASSSMAVCTLIYLHFRQFSKWYALFFIWPLLFISSRLFLAVHYPSDVIVGAVVGILVALFMNYLSKRFLRQTIVANT